MDIFIKIKMGLTIIFLILTVPILKALLGAPFVPTPKKTLEKMFAQIQLKPQQVIYDLGCGDGRFVRFAARRYGAKSIGIELNPFLYLYAKIRSLGRKNETIFFCDFQKVDLRDADYIVCYLLPKTMGKMEKKLQRELKKGAKIISHCFQFQNWRPITQILPEKKEYGKIFIYAKD